MNILGIIPARFASTRFPGKPLALIKGKSMIQRVFEQASKSAALMHLIVATDDDRIYNHVLTFGGNVMMTSLKHKSGTERCGEVLEKFRQSRPKNNVDAVINIQGDEPFIDPRQIDLIASAIGRPGVDIATLGKKISSATEISDPNIVKIVLNRRQEALYFSRSPIPFIRGYNQPTWHERYTFYKHIGIYAYRADILRKITGLEPTLLEKAESLEQLRWIGNGYVVRVELTDLESIAIDTPGDLLKITNTT
jgi:3-deoxy-manno-octulosonate cytidylyltransferase (CMP-KDO synthetase)